MCNNETVGGLPQGKGVSGIHTGFDIYHGIFVNLPIVGQTFLVKVCQFFCLRGQLPIGN